MNSEEELLDLVKRKFPRQNKRIEQLFEENADFRTLCLDYYICLASLKKFKQSYTENEQSIDDFEKVMVDLELELYSFIF